MCFISVYLTVSQSLEIISLKLTASTERSQYYFYLVSLWFFIIIYQMLITAVGT